MNDLMVDQIPNWEKFKIKDVVNFIVDNRGKNPPRYSDDGIPVIDNFQITGKRSVDLNESKRFIDEEIFKSFIRKHIQKNDLLITLVGNGYGNVALAPEELSVIIQNTIGLRCKSNCLNEYLFYFLSLNKRLIEDLDRGAAQPSVKVSDLLNIKLLIPELDYQNIIVSILRTYDDLIEINGRRIQLLEQMAQLLYREWFVEFRFPGYEKCKFIDSELGKIPEGWRLATLNDTLSALESGRRPAGGIDDKENGVVSVGAENIIGLGKYDYSADKFVSEDFYNSMRSGHVNSGDVLLYKDGAQIGRKSMFRDEFPHKICSINEHVFILRTNDLLTQNYLYFWLDLPNITDMIINSNSNAAQPGINQQDIFRLPILIPDPNTLIEFEKLVDPMIELLFNLAKSNNNLNVTRDMLLPKLMSGEIDVSKLDIKGLEN